MKKVMANAVFVDADGVRTPRQITHKEILNLVACYIKQGTRIVIDTGGGKIEINTEK